MEHNKVKQWKGEEEIWCHTAHSEVQIMLQTFDVPAMCDESGSLASVRSRTCDRRRGGFWSQCAAHSSQLERICIAKRRSSFGSGWLRPHQLSREDPH